MKYRPHEFADIAGVSVKTLHRWDESGKLKALRTMGEHRYYDDTHVNQIKKLTAKDKLKAMKQFCTASGIPIDKVIIEIGGGLNFKRKKFLSLLAEILTGNVNQVIVAHKDRLCRFAFDLVEHIANSCDCSILVANNDALSPQQELVEDMMAIVHCFSCRLYGARNYKNKFKENLDKNLDIKIQSSCDVQC
jgi:putative resolvase